MPDYQYVARELTGQQVSGTLTATSQQDALSALAARDLFPVQIDLADSAKLEQKRSSRRIPRRLVTMFYSQLADLLRSGVPLLRSLHLLERQIKHTGFQFVLADVIEQVADGRRLADALRQHPRAFSPLGVSMVTAGEEGSFLEDVLKRIAAFNEHQEELQSKVVGAMVYPVFLLGAGVVIVVWMLVQFVPKFAKIFTRMEEAGQLPWATTTLLAISDLMQAYWWVLLIGLAGLVVMYVNWSQTPEGREKIDYFRLHSKGVGPIVRSLAIARFCRILGTLLANGVPILQSLRISKDASGNVVLARAIGDAADNVSSGKTLAQPLGSCGQFPDEVVEMIAVGEEANNLEQVLIDIADNMERRTNRQLELFVRLLEPAMLLVMAALVVFVIAALLLPVLQMSGTF